MLSPLASLVMLIVGAADPAPVGLWEGTLEIGAIRMRLAFKFEAKSDGTLAGKMDSPDQGAKDIPLSEVKFADNKVTLIFKPGGAEYVGTLAPDGKSMKGDWKQSGLSLPLTLTRVDKLTERKRPQLPKKPYPYYEEEVTFENDSAKITLAGTFTRPKADGKYPTVVLISGSGPQDRDESLMGHKPFLVIADHLARQGIAVLRYDDRGIGKSKGKHSTATSADFATDAWAAVQYLKTRGDVEVKRIGLAGHSEGGLIAPLVAAEHADYIGFIVLLAGPGLPGDEVLGDQLTAIMRAAGASDHQIKLQRELQQGLLKLAKAGGNAKEAAAKMNEFTEAFMKNLSEADRKSIETGLPGTERNATNAAAPAAKAGESKDKAKDDSAKQFARLTAPWMVYFLQHDPRPTLARVRCPVLALNGEKDLQVTPRENLAAVAEALKAGGNESVTLKEFAGLNHLFQHSKTGLVSEYGEIEETIAPEVLDTITAWIKARK